MSQPKAIELATKQREISVSDFFAKNRHLLGFDNKRKALLTTVKEAVDNALDACEEAEFLPEVSIELVEMSEDRFKIIIEDNGPGIVKAQIPKIFAKLLYGSKFFKLSQSRGQQGIGISASVMYGQLTTGKPAKITSRIDKTHPAHYYELHIDTNKNKPEILKDTTVEWEKDHGTKVEIDLEGTYLKGPQSVDEYLKQTAIVNPHVTLIYTNPKAEQLIFPRVSETTPARPREIKPHPYGIELGVLIRMLKFTQARTVQSFLTQEFSRIGPGTAKEMCQKAALLPDAKPQKVSREMAEKLMRGMQTTKVIAPPTDCISPIGSELLERGLKKEVNAEFYSACSRPPSVYRGNPFAIEAAIAYGGELPAEGHARLLRFANRVPLLYQQGACAITDSVQKTNWRQYHLQQSSNSIPQGPVVLIVHMASVWVPFTSESKEALAHYPEIKKEIRLAIQECGRNLARYLSKKRRVGAELKKRSFIEKYIPHVGIALKELLKLNEAEQVKVEKVLEELLEKHRGKLDKLDFDPSANPEYDEEFANIGKEDDTEESDS
ncbi:MAG: DNA topoisomerase VI subunit B [Nanoarchaeota archaeon]|nr:DNA topoisomerase VI subunit B [Nanoarchaeota archaeon]